MNVYKIQRKLLQTKTTGKEYPSKSKIDIDIESSHVEIFQGNSYMGKEFQLYWGDYYTNFHN